MKNSSHWYDVNGTAVFELPNKSKPGTRPTKITDARALSLFPSVTTVLGVLAKPQLDDWKHRQITAWCWNNPIEDGIIPSQDGYHTLAMEGAFAQVSDAADLGTGIHAALEAHFQGNAYDAKFAPYVEAVDKWAKAEGVVFEEHELRLVNKAHGYAGTTDAVIYCPRGRGILDFKSRKTTPGKAVTPYDTEPMQVAAYMEARFERTRDLSKLFTHVGVNVFISTTEPGRVEPCWYDAEQLWKEWEAFQAVLTLWRHLRGYDPRMAA